MRKWPTNIMLKIPNQFHLRICDKWLPKTKNLIIKKTSNSAKMRTTKTSSTRGKRWSQCIENERLQNCLHWFWCLVTIVQCFHLCAVDDVIAPVWPRQHGRTKEMPIFLIMWSSLRSPQLHKANLQYPTFSMTFYLNRRLIINIIIIGHRLSNIS